ncbi:hypothetical protein FXB39_02115 [Nocardioides sp. BGMRC 2183]|nr:hypothetical protein FXB39_02115 [Nocardioides sp. BGMRC 2183]
MSAVVKGVLMAVLIVTAVVSCVVVIRLRFQQPLKRAGVLVGLSNGAASRIHAELAAAAPSRQWEVTSGVSQQQRLRDPALATRASRADSCDGVVAGRHPRPFTAVSWRGKAWHPGGVRSSYRLHDLSFPLRSVDSGPHFCAAPLTATHHPQRLLPDRFWGQGHVAHGLVAWGVGLDPTLMQWIASLAQPLTGLGCWLVCLGDRVVLFGEGEPPLDLLERRIAFGAWVADTLERPLC